MTTVNTVIATVRLQAQTYFIFVFLQDRFLARQGPRSTWQVEHDNRNGLNF